VNEAEEGESAWDDELHLMVDGTIEFLAGDSCRNKGDQLWWECGSMKNCCLMSMDDLCHLLRHKREGYDGRGRLL
jgi:hypothetical protein